MFPNADRHFLVMLNQYGLITALQILYMGK